jgi:hypothetical protein
MALWQRSDGWTFAAGLGVNLAVSLLFWDGYLAHRVENWQMLLAQVNLVTFAATALLWLGARQLDRTGAARTTPPGLLEVQLSVGVTANLVFLLGALSWLVTAPDGQATLGNALTSAWMSEASSPLGWLAWVLTGAAVAISIRQRRLPLSLHIAAMLGLVLLGQTACTVESLEPGWGYRTLMLGWAGFALAFALLTWRVATDRAAAAGQWVRVIGAVVVLLALRTADRQEDYLWAAASIGVASLAAAVIALRQRSEGWAVAAGLGINLAVSLVFWDYYPDHTPLYWPMRLAQVNLVTSAAMALLWLGAQRLNRADTRASAPGLLLTLQLGVGAVGNGVLLLGALDRLVSAPVGWAVGLEHPPGFPWIFEAGSALGWLAWGFLGMACIVWARRRGLVVSVHGVALAGLVTLGQVACTVEALAPGWGYRMLMLAWAAFLPVLVPLARYVRARRAPVEEEPPSAGRESASERWIAFIALGVVVLALRAAVWHSDHVWAAAAIALASTGAALTALWQRREGWAFAAGLGINLAVSLLVWHGEYAIPPEQWWVSLFQANVITASTVALLWLAGRRWLSPEGRSSGFAPLLSLQIILAAAGNATLLIGPAVLLVRQPAPVHDDVIAAGQPWGWVALFLATAAALWHAGQMLSRGRLHVLCTLGLALGVLAACTMGWLDRGDWLAYHVLMVGCALTGTAALAGGWRVSLRPRFLDVPLSDLAGKADSSTVAIRIWIAAIAALLVGLALRGALVDPGAPWWPAGGILAAVVLAAGVGLWQRSEGWVFAAALALNLAASLFLWHQYKEELLERWWVYLVQANALATAAAALLWLAVRQRLYGRATLGVHWPPLLTLQVVLGLAANAVLVVVAATLLIQWPGHVPSLVLEVGRPWGWMAFLPALSAAAWYLGPTLARVRIQTLAVVVLALGVLTASTAGQWDRGDWLAYHVLMIASVMAGLATLAAGWWDTRLRMPKDEQATVTPASGLVQVFVAVISAAVLGLTLRGLGHDPQGNSWSAAVVLALSVTAALMALWQRQELWAFSAGLALNLAVSLFLGEFYRQESLTNWWVPLVQANVLAASAAALLWLTVRHLRYGAASRERPAPLLTVQVVLGLLGNAALLVGPGAHLVLDPGQVDPIVLQAGEFWGWLSLLAALAAAVWHVGQTLARGAINVLCLLGLGIGVLAACTAGHWDSDGHWLAYHTLMAAWTFTAAVTLTLGWRFDRSRQGLEATASVAPIGLLQGWVTVLGALVVGLAVRGIGLDPTGPVWTASITLVGSALFGALALWSRRQVHVYISGLLVNLGGTVLLSPWNSPLELVQVNVLCLALASAFWSVAELVRRRTGALDLRGGWLPFSHLAAGVAVCALAALAGLGVTLDFTGAGMPTAGPLTWASLAACACALGACLRDPDAHLPLAGLYLLGLSALALLLHGIAPTPRWLAGALLASYVLLAAVLWALGRREDGLGLTLRRAVLVEASWGLWFAPAQALLASAALALSVWTCVSAATVAQREMGALAVGLLLPAGLLMERAHKSRRLLLQYAILALGVLLTVEASWAWLDPGAATFWLYRTGLLLTVFTLMTILYGIILVRSLPPQSGWADVSRQTGTLLGALAVAALAGVLAQEVLLFRPGLDVSEGLPGSVFIVSVALAVAVMIVTAVALAVVPGLDPFGLSERGRTAYVYAAEVLLVLLFAQLRLSAPALFNRDMQRYWPFAVVGIAFLGAATGELFRRLGLRVLAEPLERTGVFLPMLPVAVFWVQPPSDYATVWFLVGLLYVFLSVTRRSLGFALLATVAANVGLWLVLHQNQLAFIQHPQLWLIPFALSVLGAEHFNQNRLSKGQRNTIRYLALTVIYVSSTAETFLAGLGQDALRPVVLVVLSLLGVFMGMLLRVRAFLFLGSAFLLLGIFAVIRHAAHAAEDKGRIIWLVAGIVLGVVIFTLFAIFEKRRNDVMRLLQRLKDWE